MVMAQNRVRRLYCLECGDGSYVPLPATQFVAGHVKKHNLVDDKADESFLVVERLPNQNILLDQSLSTMFQKTFLEWGGAVDKASKYVRPI